MGSTIDTKLFAMGLERVPRDQALRDRAGVVATLDRFKTLWSDLADSEGLVRRPAPDLEVLLVRPESSAGDRTTPFLREAWVEPTPLLEDRSCTMVLSQQLLEDFQLAALGCLSAAHVFPDVGTPDRSTTITSAIPADPERARFARLLTELSVEFTLFHEASHVLRGHLQLLTYYPRSEVRLHECRSEAVPEDLAAIHHGLEVDADSVSVFFLFDALLNGHTALGSEMEGLDPGQRGRLLGFALTIHGRLLELWRRDRNPATPLSRHRTHPHPDMREAQISAMVSNVCSGGSKPGAKELAEGYALGVDEARHAMQSLRTTFPGYGMVDALGEDAAREWIRHLVECKKRVQAELEPHAFLDLQGT